MKKLKNGNLRKDIFELLQLAALNNLYDRFDFDRETLYIYQKNFNGVMSDYLHRKFTITDFVNYGKKHGHDAYDWAKSIPTTYKLRLMNDRVQLTKLVDVDSYFITFMYISNIVLHEICNMNDSSIDAFNVEMLDYIDSLCGRQPKCHQPWITKDDIKELLSEELNIKTDRILIVV